MAQKDIRVLMPSDIAAFRIVADCCNIDKKELLARSGMTKSRFKVWEKEKGYFRTVPGTRGSSIATTSEGRKYISKIINKPCYYSSSPKHDKKLDLFIQSLSPSEQASYKNASEVLKMFNEIKKFDPDKYSNIDGMYFSDAGEWVCVEIETYHYKTSVIEKKHEFCEVLGVQYNGIR